ncbi:hypothetical protein IAU60_001866 [Kwoniella sp. DSM 27419]
MPLLPSFSFLQRKSGSQRDDLPPGPVTIFYLSSPPSSPSATQGPLRPVAPSTSPRTIPPDNLLFSLTHPHPSTSRPTAFFLSCLPDPIGFLYHSAALIRRHLCLDAGNDTGVDWRHQLIQLELEDKEGLAATSGGKIGVSLQWVDKVMQTVDKGERKMEGAVKEFKGVLLHELVHTIQHDGSGTTPGWLIESMADYVRLQAGLDPPHWRKAGQGRDDKGWEDGYDAGARFLDWIVGSDDGAPAGATTTTGIPTEAMSQLNIDPYNPTPTATITQSGANQPRPTQITEGMLHPKPDGGQGPMAAPRPRPPQRERPGPFPDFVKLVDARLKHERWSDHWWSEMTGYELEGLWRAYLDYHR